MGFNCRGAGIGSSEITVLALSTGGITVGRGASCTCMPDAAVGIEVVAGCATATFVGLGCCAEISLRAIAPHPPSVPVRAQATIKARPATGLDGLRRLLAGFLGSVIVVRF